jgi:hypothetical protein
VGIAAGIMLVWTVLTVLLWRANPDRLRGCVPGGFFRTCCASSKGWPPGRVHAVCGSGPCCACLPRAGAGLTPFGLDAVGGEGDRHIVDDLDGAEQQRVGLDAEF